MNIYKHGHFLPGKSEISKDFTRGLPQTCVRSSNETPGKCLHMLNMVANCYQHTEMLIADG